MAVIAEGEEEEVDAMAITAEEEGATVAEGVGANVLDVLMHVELDSFQVADTVAVEEVLEDTPAASATTIFSTEVRAI